MRERPSGMGEHGIKDFQMIFKDDGEAIVELGAMRRRIQMPFRQNIVATIRMESTADRMI